MDMTAYFRATWLPAGIARKAVLPPVNPRVPTAERAAALETVAFDAADADVPADLDPPAEPDWADELFDPARDGDPFEWLGFGPESG
jgi:hypothetical protein